MKHSMALVHMNPLANNSIYKGLNNTGNWYLRSIISVNARHAKSSVMIT